MVTKSEQSDFKIKWPATGEPWMLIRCGEPVCALTDDEVIGLCTGELRPQAFAEPASVGAVYEGLIAVAGGMA